MVVKHMASTLYEINPSAWSDGQCPHSKNTMSWSDGHRPQQAARLQLLSLLSSYERMNESLHVAGSARHSTTWCFCYADTARHSTLKG
jgi:hypothetical protein